MKTKPIGVRFDLDKLDRIKQEQNLTTPQAVVNWLVDNYGQSVDKPIVRDLNKEAEPTGTKINVAELVKKHQEKNPTPYDLARRLKKNGF